MDSGTTRRRNALLVIMKFKTGNLLCHTPSGSTWIIVSSKPYEGEYKKNWTMTVDAFCVYSGKDKKEGNNYWTAGMWDTWLLSPKDTHPMDKLWKIINEV